MKPIPSPKKLVASLLLALSATTPTLQAQVVGYWQFNEKSPGGMTDTGAGAIVDASGNGHQGTASLALPYVAGSPAYGSSSAITFYTNGATDKIVVPDGAAGAFNFSAGQSVTIEAVIHARSAGLNGSSTGGNIMSKQGAVAAAPLPGEWYLRLINTAGNVRFTASDGSSKTATGSKSVLDGKWHHVAGIYDASAHQLRVYVDYVLDAAVTTSFTGTIGNTNDVCFGQQNNNGARFDGDIDFIKFSQGALDPTNFVQASTSIANFSPTNGATFVSPANIARFTVGSAAGVWASNIVVTVNGSDVTSQLALSGDDSSRTVTLPPLTANLVYHVNIAAKDKTGFQASQTWVFDTFAANAFSIEGEDYNFGGGQFIDNPALTSQDGPDSYLDQLGQEGIDFHQINTPTLTQYRIGDLAGTAVCPDTLRQAYADARVSDPGVADYMLRDNADTEWLNYTRTFPAGTYRIYARMANPGTIPSVIQVDEVTSGSTTTTQTLAPIGSFNATPSSGATDYEFVPLRDALGNEAGVSLGGQRTVRLTFVSAGANVLLNYLLFVPVSGTQPPFLASVSPAPGAGNALSNAPIQVSIRNADTTVNTGSIQLKLDNRAVTPTVTPTSLGAEVLYTPSNLAIGLHTATLSFSDSAALSVTNQWQFYVANQSVLGYWKFNEQTPGSLASTNAGAVLDSSGNARNGTVNVDGMSYAAGSLNYGNSSALHFTLGPDHVVVPDPAGNFIFTNAFTFEAVVRSTNTATTTGTLLAKNGTTDGEGEFWWRLPGATGGRQEVGMNNQVFLVGTNALNDGAWHHVAVVYDQPNNQVLLYADYVLEATAATAFTKPIGRPTDLFIGSFVNGGSEFDGDIDSIRISNGALTPEQFISRTVPLQPIVKTLRPANGANNVSPWSPVEAEFQNRDTAVDLSSLKLFIDGADVTAAATKTMTSGSTVKISFVPTTPLADGGHTATTIFSDTGTPASSWTNSWSFTNLALLPVRGFYEFNEQPAGGIADSTPGAIRDYSGSGRNGTAVSQTGIPYIAGSADYGNTPALAFTVNNTNHIAVADPTGAFNWNPTQSVTLEAVVRTTTIGQSSVGCIMAKQLLATPEWWWRINANGTQQFNVNDSSGAKGVSGTKVLNDGQWHHLAVIYDGQAKQMKAYVDYVQDGPTVGTTYTSSTSTIGNSEDLYIGAFQAGNRIFEGDLDVVRFTAAALDVSSFIPLGGVAGSMPLTDIVTTGGSVGFRFVTEVGRSYVIQATGALGSPWTDIETIAGDGSLKAVTYSATGPQRFFRVKVQ